MKVKKHYLWLLIILFVGVPAFCLGKEVTTPKTLRDVNSEDVKSWWNKFLDFFPGALEKVWQDAIAFWKGLFEKTKELWDEFLGKRIKISNNI